MKKLKVIVFIAIALCSCKAIKHVEGKTYHYKSKKRTLELFFDNDDKCRLKNVFYCNDISVNLRDTTIFCIYRKNKDTIFLKNIDCINDTCQKPLTVLIPPQESKECAFLSSSKRKRSTTLGPSYATDYERYGLIPNIDIDTLYIIRNKIIFYKKDTSMNVGFIFK